VKRAIVMALSVILALTVAAPVGFAQSVTDSSANQNPRVVPPTTGKYAPLSAQWWQWAFKIPKPRNPLTDPIDPTGTKCARGQSGKVWFLGSQVGESTHLPPAGFTVDRVCNVPAGTQLFFPIINTECSGVIPGNPPRHELNCKNTFKANSKIAKSLVSSALKGSTLKASVDGVKIKNLDPRNTPYRVASPPFTFDLPANSINTFCGDGTKQCGPATDVKAAADGVYLLLVPLPKGRHVIRFGGNFPAINFHMNNRYVIHVR
jgi:hypothetical protein